MVAAADVPGPLDWLLPTSSAAADASWSPLRPGPATRRAELETMCRQGLAVHVAGDVYLPADAAGWRAGRVAAVRALAPSGSLVGLMTAAWVLGAPVRLDAVEVLVDRAGAGWRLPGGLREVESRVPPDEETTLLDLRLTTPARTVADVARHYPAESARPAVAALLERHTGVAEVHEVLSRERRAFGVVRARALLRELAGEDADVTSGRSGSGRR